MTLPFEGTPSGDNSFTCSHHYVYVICCFNSYRKKQIPARLQDVSYSDSAVRDAGGRHVAAIHYSRHRVASQVRWRFCDAHGRLVTDSGELMRLMVCEHTRNCILHPLQRQFDGSYRFCPVLYLIKELISVAAAVLITMD